MTLEDEINKQMDDITRYTRMYIRRRQPFEYISRLAMVGQSDYAVDYQPSFEHGLNASLDIYNFYMKKGKKNPEQAKEDALVHGAVCLIRYVNHQMRNPD